MNILRRIGKALFTLIAGAACIGLGIGLPAAGGFWLMGVVEDYALLYWPLAIVTGMLGILCITGTIGVLVSTVAALCQSDTSWNVFQRYP